MALKLTAKQETVLNYIANFNAEHDFSPTYREIMEGLGLKSVSSVAEHVENLVNKGALKRRPNEARSLEIVDTSYPETTELFKFYLAQADDSQQVILRQAADILGIEL